MNYRLILFFVVLLIFSSTSTSTCTFVPEYENEYLKQLLTNDKIHIHCCTGDQESDQESDQKHGKQIELENGVDDKAFTYESSSSEIFYFGIKSENSELSSSDLGTEMVLDRNTIISRFLEYPCVTASLACVCVAFLVYLFCVCFFFISKINK